MKPLPKKVRRQISADEHLQRYFHHLEADFRRRMSRMWKLASIRQKRDDGILLELQITRIHETPEGVFVEVR